MSETEVPDALARLARACGISTEYTAWDGQVRPCSPAAIRAALGAMDIDASDDAAAEQSLARLEEYVWARVVPPVTVLTRGTSGAIPVHVRLSGEVDVTLTLEDGSERALAAQGQPSAPRGDGPGTLVRHTVTVPPDLPLGWHRIEARAPGVRARGYVVVTPERLTVGEGSAQQWGLATQLYSLRSSRSWGMGDFGDLAELCTVAHHRAGASFVLINPIHASSPVSPIEPSPYLPVSRRFVSPLYIRVEDIPEVAYLPSQHRAVVEWGAERPKRANATDQPLDRDLVWAAKREALKQIYQVERSPGRQAQFEAFCLREGGVLEDFATWCALREAYNGLAWPAEFAVPSARAVADWRQEHADEVLFHAWLQWVADEQLAQAQRVAREAGMGIGVMTDLAVGVHPEGADAWAWQRVLAAGITLGAPPDMYNQQGQNWSQPPWQPRALESAAYLPFREVVRAAVRHTGAVRIDHVLGMFRQWWIPEGHPPDDGVYVTFNHEALMGIVALEAQRAGAMVIGEDLGTLQPWVTDYLNSRGILGTSIVWFEKGEGGGPKEPEHYRRDAMVSVTTHDLPPTAAYVAGEHVDLRDELGLLVRDVEALRTEALDEVAAMTALVSARGWLREDFNSEDLMAAIHRLAFATPARLVCVAVTDLVGEKVTQNQPGTSTEYPNWKVPLCDSNGVPVLLDQLFEHPRVQRLLAGLALTR